MFEVFENIVFYLVWIIDNIIYNKLCFDLLYFCSFGFVVVK